MAWTCPECGRTFANTNQWHSCIELALDDHLAGKSEVAVDLYRALESATRSCGDFRIHPQKSRIAFINTMTFAGARLARQWIDVAFIVPEPISDPRIRSIDMYGPTSFGHEVRINSPTEIGPEVRAWLCVAYERGTQSTLDPAADVQPVTGLALERLTVPLAASAVEVADRLAVRIPAWAAAALADAATIAARIKGSQVSGMIEDDADGWTFVPSRPHLRELGFGVGDPIDVFLRAAG